MSKKKRGSRIWLVVGVIVALLILLVLWSVKMAYDGSSSVLTRAVERVVPIPAATVGRTPIALASLRQNLDATRNFYENQDLAKAGVRVDFTTEEGAKKLKIWERVLLDKLVEDVVVMKLAKQEGIVITDAQAQERVAQEISRYGSKGVAENTVRRLWNFSMDDFVRYIVKPQLYREALERAVITKQDTTKWRAQALSAKAALDQGSEFDAVLKQYSDTADNASEAVWFRLDELIDAVAKSVPQIVAGGYSDVIESSRGFHIIAVDDRRGEGASSAVLLRQIIVYKPLFSQWLDQKIRTFDIGVQVDDYQWNAQTAHIEFVDEQMREFEKAQLETGSEG